MNEQYSQAVDIVDVSYHLDQYIKTDSLDQLREIAEQHPEVLNTTSMTLVKMGF